MPTSKLSPWINTSNINSQIIEKIRRGSKGKHLNDASISKLWLWQLYPNPTVLERAIILFYSCLTFKADMNFTFYMQLFYLSLSFVLSIFSPVCPHRCNNLIFQCLPHIQSEFLRSQREPTVSTRCVCLLLWAWPWVLVRPACLNTSARVFVCVSMRVRVRAPSVDAITLSWSDHHRRWRVAEARESLGLMAYGSCCAPTALNVDKYSAVVARKRTVELTCWICQICNARGDCNIPTENDLTKRDVLKSHTRQSHRAPSHSLNYA